jgi:hypothetical protein
MLPNNRIMNAHNDYQMLQGTSNHPSAIFVGFPPGNLLSGLKDLVPRLLFCRLRLVT